MEQPILVLALILHSAKQSYLPI